VRHRRPLLRVVLVGGLAATILVVLAGPASAHAVLLSTTPSQGAVLTTPPSSVSLHYDEQVTFNPGAVRVYNQQGGRVDDGSITKPSADVVQVGVRSHLPDGAYVVTWRVISADTHPVEGAFTFQVGLTANATAPNVTGLAQNLLHNQRGSKTVGVVYGIIRGTLYAGIALLLGALAFAGFLWGEARRLRRTAQLLWAGWILTAFATIVALFLQGIYGAALSFSALFRLSLLRATLGTSFGHMVLVRLVLLVAAVPVLRALCREPAAHPLPRWWRPGVALGAVAVALTLALSGHAHTGTLPSLGVPADVIHVLAMSVWLGGLAVLSYAVFPRRGVTELREVVPRFSRTAMVCVGALVVTGSFQAWRQVGSLNALRTTDYGKTLLVKLVLVLVLVILGAMSRQIVGYLFATREAPVPEPKVPVVTGGADDDPSPNGDGADDADVEWELDEGYELRRLKRSVFVEVLVAVLIISATALLVDAAPAKVAAAQRGTGASQVTLKSPEVWMSIYLTPGVAPGANDVHVSALLPTGAPLNLVNLTTTLDYPGRHIPPLEIPLRHLGPGHYLSPGFTIPFSGGWRVTTHAQLNEFTEVTLAGTLSIG
jgi:copper transport protein